MRKVFKLYGSFEVRQNLITWVVGISLRGRKERILSAQKKREVLSKLAKRKHRAKQTAAETAIFVYTQSSKLGFFRRILVKTGTQINSPIVASVGVITSLGKHIFSKDLLKETTL